jgi:hypothetical protein
MADVTNPATGELTPTFNQSQAAQNSIPAQNLSNQGLPSGAPVVPPVAPVSNPLAAKPVDPKTPAKLSKDETVKLHHDSIRQLAMELRGASPSAAESISDKILAALDAIHDPEAWQKSQDVAKKTEDEREAERKVIRDKMRPGTAGLASAKVA